MAKKYPTIYSKNNPGNSQTLKEKKLRRATIPYILNEHSLLKMLS